MVFILYVLFGATEMVWSGTGRTICAWVLGLGTLVLLICTIWMTVMHRAFDYNGKRKLAKVIVEGTAEYVQLPEGGTGLDVGCGSDALTIASAKRNPQAKMVGCDIWSGAYKAVFSQKRCEDNARAEGVSNVSFQDGNAVHLPFPDETWLPILVPRYSLMTAR